MAAAQSSLGTQFKEELTCSICNELFTYPKILPCKHTFCQDCLHTRTLECAVDGVSFHCPISSCHLEFELPPQRYACWPDNDLLKSLCEKLPNLEATLSRENRCSFHPSEEVKLYCKQCNMLVCSECCEEGHDGHSTISTLQTLIIEGGNILKSYCSFIGDLRKEEKTLNEQKQQTGNSIFQAYNQLQQTMAQKLTDRKDQLLSESEQYHSENLDRIQTERDRVSADVKELSAACDRAEQALQQGGTKFLSLQTALTEVVGKYRGKAAPTPVQTQPAVFQPADTQVPVLGHVMVQSLPSAPIPAVPAGERGTGHHQGSQKQGESQPRSVTVGRKGSRNGRFKSPLGVTVSDEGEIFVADNRNKRIQLLTLQGTFSRQFPTSTKASFSLRRFIKSEGKMDPHDVAIDGEGNLWVVGGTESAELAVQYNKQGRVLGRIVLQKTGWGRGVAVDTRRNILITQATGDKGNLQGKVLVFRPDGTLVRTVGQQQGMKYPWFLTVGGEGNILVSDCDNSCIYVYNEDEQFLFKFKGEGSGEGQLKEPYGICTDRAGNIIVADCGNSRVEMFDKAGKFLKHITTNLFSPLAVTITTQGQLVVTDDERHTVSIFYT